MVLSARGETRDAKAALARLCDVYWYPLYAYVRRQGHSSHDAQDSTQAFFARLLEKGWLDDVTRERGRFRAFLLAAMKHFLANERDHARAAKRGGGMIPIPLDDGNAEARYQKEAINNVSAEQLYDQRWAQALLAQVMTRLRAEMSDAGKLDQFESLKFCLTGEKAAYADVARQLGITEGAVKVAVHRLRARYRALLRAEIAETVATAEEVEDELRHLFAALSA
jgi:RNA polymerase sigma-70 factor (ECF subfamily)